MQNSAKCSNLALKCFNVKYSKLILQEKMAKSSVGTCACCKIVDITSVDNLDGHITCKGENQLLNHLQDFFAEKKTRGKMEQINYPWILKLRRMLICILHVEK